MKEILSLQKFTLTGKNFVKSTIYVVISLVKPLLYRNIFEKSAIDREFYQFSHCVKANRFTVLLRKILSYLQQRSAARRLRTLV